MIPTVLPSMLLSLLVPRARVPKPETTSRRPRATRHQRLADGLERVRETLGSWSSRSGGLVSALAPRDDVCSKSSVLVAHTQLDSSQRAWENRLRMSRSMSMSMSDPHW